MAGTRVRAGAVLAVTVAVGLAGCTSSTGSPAAVAPTATTATAAPSTTPAVTATTATTATATAGTPTASATTAGVDRDFGQRLRLDGSRLTYDELVWYTGAAADAICRQRDHADCPMDHTTEDLHTAASGTVDASTRIVLLAQQADGIRPVPGSLAQLATVVRDPRWSPYWRIQRDGDHVTSIEHVYVP